MRYFVTLLALFFSGCSCSSGSSMNTMRIGVDKQWYPINFGEQNSYVNGFTEELLNEMSRYSGLEFEVIKANWDNLEMGLKEGKYDAVLTSIPPYEYNKGKYHFSGNFLDIGPVLIIPVASRKTELSRLNEELVGAITNDPALLILAKYPSIIQRQYPTIPALLDALTRGEISAAILDQVPAVQYVSDLYAGVLMIAGQPMNDKGLHMMGDSKSVEAFDKSLKALKRRSTVNSLLKKWELTN